MRRVSLLLALVGAAATIALIIHVGVGKIAHSLSLVGFGLVGLIVARLGAVGLDALGWRWLVAPFDTLQRAGAVFLTWAALVRESVARLLPVASVGGDLAGIRLLMLRGLAGPDAAASVVVEIVVTLIAQFIFTAIGVALFLLWIDASPAVTRVAIGLLLAAPIPIVLLVLLRYIRIFEHGQRLAERILGRSERLQRWVPDGARLDRSVRQLVGQPGRLTAATAWQFAGMVAGGAEIWLILWLLGQPVSVLAAIALESIILAARHIAFFVPAGIGIQEAGFVVFGQLLGLDTQTALAVSLVRRLREVVLGVPILLSWQWAEWRAARRDTHR